MILNPEYYPAVKLLHVSCAVISISGFSIRSLLMFFNQSVMNSRWIRVVPHINDTILLTAAIWLTLFVHQFPVTDNWLTAKLAGLIGYVIFGTWALRKGKTRRIRFICFLSALIVFAYIVAVALTKSPVLNVI